MGAYLSTPIREKISSIGDGNSHKFGASSMQGWRVSQEDAHNCIPEYDPDTSTSLYAVYDGHGGPEIAQYCEMNFPKYLKNQKEYKEEKLSKALEVAFLRFDAILIQEDIMKELKEIAGVNPDVDSDEDEEAEAAALCEEATMPLDQLMERYSAHRKGTNQKYQSPFIRGKKVDSVENNDNEMPNEADVKLTLDNKLSNGHVDTVDQNETKTLENGDKKSSVETSSNSDNTNLEMDSDSKEKPSEEKPSEGKDTPDSSSNSSTSKVKETTSNIPEGGCSSSSTSDPTPGSSSGKVRKKKSSNSAEGGEDESSSEENSEEERDWGSGSDDDEEIYSEDEDDDEEDDEDEENEKGFVNPAGVGASEEPGMDSGCTAVVCLLRGSQLVVANAGDSRCVVCRDGKAIDMSIDHKPEDELERNRIEKAGGRVTLDGRVNGGLNLSRAIGDHCYKMNTDLPDTEQMITALPDVRHLILNDKDEFMILACDGIWNVMSSQEAVDFVKEELKSGTQSLSQICENLFDFCLAPNTEGDGTGCDNMTCIIVSLNHVDSKTNKRCADSEDDLKDESSNKRSKISSNGIE